MDERKPTYKELLQENERHQENRRFNDVYRSMMTCMVALIGFCCIFILAKYGLLLFLIETNTPEAWGEFCLVILNISGVFLAAYIVWHFIFVLIYNYEEEIENFIKHWRKTKESIKEENNPTFNPPE